jgi:hypothetical protein
MRFTEQKLSINQTGFQVWFMFFELVFYLPCICLIEAAMTVFVSFMRPHYLTSKTPHPPSALFWL